MAIYHLSVKTISRSAGRSATAAAAYRAGVQITDERTGDVHDYSRRGGVDSAELVLPVGAPSWASDRSALWNAAEQAEKRKNSTVAREFEIALPVELSPIERRDLAVSFARELVERHGCAADVCIHAPGKEGDNRNHHAHVLLTTRRLGRDGFGEKTRELDEAGAGKLITQWRERFASMQNERLQAAGIEARVDHRTLADQGIDRSPTVHLGPAAVGYERRTGEVSRKREDWGIEAEASERLRLAKAAGEQERREISGTILDLSRDLEAAKAEQTWIEQATLLDLDLEMGRIRPKPVQDLVERDPDVVRIRQELRELSKVRSEATEKEHVARFYSIQCRSKSPLRADLHDRGWVRWSALGDLEKDQAEGARIREELNPRIWELEKVESATRQALAERITREQAPVHERLAELMEIRDSKEERERAERAKNYARESAGQKFKKWAGLRDMRCAGWGDRGEDWQTLPPALREAVESYNATPTEGKEVFLDRLLSPQQISELDKLQKAMDRDRGR